MPRARSLGRRGDRERRRRRLRRLARHDQGTDRSGRAPAPEQGRHRPLEPARVRRERADDPDTSRRTVGRLG